jgi:hypothetical protein
MTLQATGQEIAAKWRQEYPHMASDAPSDNLDEATTEEEAAEQVTKKRKAPSEAALFTQASVKQTDWSYR